MSERDAVVGETDDAVRSRDSAATPSDDTERAHTDAAPTDVPDVGSSDAGSADGREVSDADDPDIAGDATGARDIGHDEPFDADTLRDDPPSRADVADGRSADSGSGDGDIGADVPAPLDVALDADDASSDVVDATVDTWPSDVEHETDGDAEIVPDAAPDGADTPPDDPDTIPDTAEDSAPSGPFVLYLRPDGDDRADGQTLATALATLDGANELLTAVDPDRDVEVRITPGTYLGQRVEWTYTMPDHEIAFIRANPDADRPVFDGCLVASVTDPESQCPGGTWFRLRSRSGEPTNLRWDYIRVQRYGTAISLEGNRNDADASNGNNTIYGCYFDQIGNVFNPSLRPSTAAVRFVNSDDNHIANTHFANIVNTTSEGLIHAIYIAHMSDRNRILRNRFYRNSGDAIRVRDYSNDNVINDNRFIQAGYAGYSSWYCNHDTRDDCTKPAPECPSWGNQFRNNALDGSWTCDPMSTFVYYVEPGASGCSPPSADAVRLQTSGNVKVDPPCSGL